MSSKVRHLKCALCPRRIVLTRENLGRLHRQNGVYVCDACIGRQTASIVRGDRSKGGF